MRPSPPLNTTHYIIFSKSDEKFELPPFGCRSPENSDKVNAEYQENTPDTCDSMEGKNKFYHNL